MIPIFHHHHRSVVHPELSEILADPPRWYFYTQIVRHRDREKVNEEKGVAIPEMDLDLLVNGFLGAKFQEPLAIRADGGFDWEREEETVTLLFRSGGTHCPV